MPKGSPGQPRPWLRKNILERIERHMPEMRDGECWESTYKSDNTYGHKLVRPEQWEGTPVYVHRVVWEAHNAEPIPEGMVVRHTCDNPSCCNPEHLVLGTLKDNTADMYERGRENTTRDPKTGRYQ